MFDYVAKELKQSIIDTLGPLSGEGVPPYEVTFKFMFGGIMAYTCGRPFCSLSNAGMAVKLPANDIAGLIKAGGYPLRYEPQAAASKSYTVIPKDIIKASGSGLEGWLIKSMDHCKSLPLPKKRKPKNKKK